MLRFLLRKGQETAKCMFLFNLIKIRSPHLFPILRDDYKTTDRKQGASGDYKTTDRKQGASGDYKTTDRKQGASGDYKTTDRKQGASAEI